MNLILATLDAYDLLHTGSIALAQVEANGMRIDEKFLQQTIKDTERKIKDCEAKLIADEIWRTWRKVFSGRAMLGSREQLGHVLFQMMGYECKEYTRTGRPKVDESALEAVNHPFVKEYLRWGKLNKVRGTYLEGIRREVVDGYLHPSFNLNLVRTYRSSSDTPNFQNLPIRNPEFAEIVRRCFIARKGHRIVEIDYGGLEVRIAACYHRDPVMIRYLTDPSSDMHRDAAMDCYLLEGKQVSKQTRYAAKNQFVFPEFYGSYYKLCAVDLWDSIDRLKLRVRMPGDEKEETGPTLKQHLRSKGIKKLGTCDPEIHSVPGTFEHHIREAEERLWKRFSGYAQWKLDWWNQYQEEGGFSLKTGFRINAVHKKNDVLNYAVQGASFHCLLWSLIRLQKWLTKTQMQTVIVGQIHDSLILDVHCDEFEEVLTRVKDVMSIQLPKAWDWIIVPLEVEIEACPVGGSWFEKEKVK